MSSHASPPRAHLAGGAEDGKACPPPEPIGRYGVKDGAASFFGLSDRVPGSEFPLGGADADAGSCAARRAGDGTPFAWFTSLHGPHGEGGPGVGVAVGDG